jgi:hypothetical protein
MDPLPRQMPLRLPASLHEELKAAASGEGLSLNQYCLYILARHGIHHPSAQRRRGEDLLKFLAEANILQKEFGKGRSPAPKPAKDLGETPVQRFKKLYGKNKS